jgi:hypothetical protein
MSEPSKPVAVELTPELRERARVAGDIVLYPLAVGIYQPIAQHVLLRAPDALALAVVWRQSHPHRLGSSKLPHHFGDDELIAVVFQN